MKKRILIPIIAAVILLAVLFMPMSWGTYNDGGTREWIALTYKIVSWKRLCDGGEDGPFLYEKTRIYGPADRNKSIDELWERESADFGNRSESYTDEWIEKSDRTKTENTFVRHVRITEIYDNCFFAVCVAPMPYQIKLNGKLSYDWCVGDQINCTTENTYYDREKDRMETDMLTIESDKWLPEPFVDYKPVIYLYPEKETQVSVDLSLDGRLTCTYPAHGEDGWQNFTAHPDGTLISPDGKEYYALYWEGLQHIDWDFSHGWCVRGEDTASFLEWALAEQGLTPREANEFIVYWLPLMEENPYNVISFQTEAYTKNIALEISPAPDSILRVFMTYYPTDSMVELPPQTFAPFIRQGFTVVEWGGSQEKKP